MKEAARLLNALSKLAKRDRKELDRALAKAGPRVRALREYLGWSQEEFARRLDVNPAFISLVEHNKRRLTLAMLERICSTYQVSASKILGVEERESET